MNFWIDGNHWILCEIVKRLGKIAIVRLYNEAENRTGQAKVTPNGILVYAQEQPK